MVKVLSRSALSKWVLAVVATAGLLVALFACGRWFKNQLRDDARYQFSVGDIECQVPEGETREQFLREVHYYGQLPDHLNALDQSTPSILEHAFTSHPLVLHVGGIAITNPNHVRVDLQFKKLDKKQDPKTE